MATRFIRLTSMGAFVAWAGVRLATAQEDSAGAAAAGPANSTSAMQLESWLKPQSEQQQQAAAGEKFQATTGTLTPDPFAVLTTGALWDETYGAMYTRDLGDACSLSCQTSDVVFDEDEEDLTHSRQIGLLFAPAQELSVNGNFHSSTTESDIPNNSTTTSGAALSAQSRLPWNTVLSAGLNFDRTLADMPDALAAQTDSFNAQIEQPLGQFPVSAVIKGGYQESSAGGAPAGNLPSLEQSLVWKPLSNTTFQVGLRQQQYQEYPGIDHALNEALFADLSQKMSDNVSWHSYAEVLNTKGLYTDAPGSPIASGANGTAQATLPGSNAGLTSSLPVSMQDQTLTFSTGPSVQLQKDLSASLEYSNRWDKNPAAGGSGEEQRVSVSVKGSF